MKGDLLLQADDTNSEVIEQADRDLASTDDAARWQGAIALGEFSESDPEAIWPLVEKWGSSADEDTRTAIATCVLEHVLEHSFDAFFARCAKLVRSGNIEFADTFWRCWKMGQATEPVNAAKFDRLEKAARRLVRKTWPQSEEG